MYEHINNNMIYTINTAMISNMYI